MRGQKAGGEDTSEIVPRSPPCLSRQAFLVRTRSHLSQREVRSDLGTARGSFKGAVTGRLCQVADKRAEYLLCQLRVWAQIPVLPVPMGVPVLYARSQEFAELCQLALVSSERSQNLRKSLEFRGLGWSGLQSSFSVGPCTKETDFFLFFPT